MDIGGRLSVRLIVSDYNNFSLPPNIKCPRDRMNEHLEDVYEKYGGLPPEDSMESPSIFYGGIEYTIGQHVLGGYVHRRLETNFDGHDTYGTAPPKTERELSQYVLGAAGVGDPVVIAIQNVIKKKDKLIAWIEEKITAWPPRVGRSKIDRHHDERCDGPSDLTPPPSKDCKTHPHAVYFSLPDFSLDDTFVKSAAADPYRLVSITNMIINFVNDLSAEPIGIIPMGEGEKINPLDLPRGEPIAPTPLTKQPIEHEREQLEGHLEFERELIPAALRAITAAETQLDKWLATIA